jgi:hypothetical protein
MVEAFEKIVKGAAEMAHKLVLAQKQIAELQVANEAATRRKSHKRKRLQREVVLTVSQGLELASLKEFGARRDGKRASKSVCTEEAGPSPRHYKTCRETGHDSRTCRKDAEIVSD